MVEVLYEGQAPNHLKSHASHLPYLMTPYTPQQNLRKLSYIDK